ncbi:hypothetical protein BPAE_0107g00110 [Botrytis paeoniae]|uniref:Uncharacterized protein n=1 Tax=Botrytis paeoniae TaxID=278948 RepID=A0A4Z1FHD2_9HELO|nr:hypothetical protein BPAE_0107g00110 [Botrytis paeoniae]
MSKQSQEKNESTSYELMVGAEQDTAAKEYGKDINFSKGGRGNHLPSPHSHLKATQSLRIRKLIREYANINNKIISIPDLLGDGSLSCPSSHAHNHWSDFTRFRNILQSAYSLPLFTQKHTFHIDEERQSTPDPQKISQLWLLSVFTATCCGTPNGEVWHLKQFSS